MRNTKFYCDHCGKEIDCIDGEYLDSEVETPNKRFNVDLCTDCTEKLNEFVMDFIN